METNTELINQYRTKINNQIDKYNEFGQLTSPSEMYEPRKKNSIRRLKLTIKIQNVFARADVPTNVY